MSNLEAMKRRMKFAWAKYFETNRETHDLILHYHHRLARMSQAVGDATLPTHIKAEIEEMAAAMRKQYECPICLEMIESGQLDITNCGHKYCKTCLAQLLTQPEPKCACCRKVLKGNN
jgi:hypothetical protein